MASLSTGASLRFGIVGPGRIAPRIVRGVAATARTSVTVVGGRSIDRAREFAARHAIPRAVGSYEAVVESPDVDVVYIALPNHLHADWAVRALDAGKHVLCEKPLALTVADVDRISAAAARNGRIAAEAFMYLHHPQILRALELVHGGDIGRPEVVNGAFSFTLTHPNDPRADRAMGGGSLWDVGCYPVSFARRLARADHTGLHAFARFDRSGVDRTFVGQMAFPGGLVAQFDCGFAAPDRQRLEIVGSEAALVLEAPFLSSPDGPPPSLLRWDGSDWTRVDVQPADQVALEVADFAAAILDGTPPRVDLAFSRGTIAALVEFDAAAREAAPVR